MAKQGAILNTFEKGMVRDLLPERMQPGTYYHAMNMMWGSEDHLGVFTQETSNKKFNAGSVPGKVVGVSYFAEIDQSVLFIAGSGSELHLLDHKTGELTFVMRDSDYGCNWGFGDCEMMYGELKLMECNDRVLYFSSKCEYWRVNIDEMLSPRKDCIKDCTHFQLFRCVCAPSIRPQVVEGGGYLRAGAYYVTIQMEDNDGNRSNFFPVVGPVYVGSENNIPNEVSNKSIRIVVDRADPGYSKINIVIIRKIGGVITAEQIVSRPQNNSAFTYDYYGDNPDATPIDLDEVLIRQKKFFRGSDLVQKDGRLWIYGIKQEFGVNYQKHANNIRAVAVEWEVTAETQKTFNLPTLMRGETYAFVCWLNYCDGTKSRAFHIPNTQGRSGKVIDKLHTGKASSNGPQGGYKDGTFDTSDVYNTFKATQTDPEYPDRFEDNFKQHMDGMSCADESKAADAMQKWGDYFSVGELGQCYQAEIEHASDFFQTSIDEQIQENEDDEESPLLFGGGIRDFAKKLMDFGVKRRERFKRGKPVWNYKKSGHQGPSGDEIEGPIGGIGGEIEYPDGGYDPDGEIENPGGGYDPDGEIENPYKSREGRTDYRSDLWITNSGTNLLNERPRVIDRYDFKRYESSIPYPDQCDCDGERMYPEGNILHHTVPENPNTTHFVSNHIGVPSKFDMGNSEISDTYIRLIGVNFRNIYVPTDDEVPKPLCPNNPISFGVIKRDLNDRSIIAKGILTSTMLGDVVGIPHAIPRHGVNSFETVDVAIDNNGSHIGRDNDAPGYIFHSIDTMAQKIPLTADKLVVETELYGSGWRYGLYAEGRKPEQWFTGKRVDQRGARQAVSLMQQLNHEEEREITGLTYAPANSVVTAPGGVTYPLCNRFRESCVYLELDSKLQLRSGVDRESDASFVGDTLDHEAPISNAAAWYVSLRRDIPDQYGAVSNQNAASLGIEVIDHEPGGIVNVAGICGDTIVGMHSFKRSGYVSDKVGEKFPISNGSTDGRRSPWKRDRAICDHPADLNFQNLGMDHWATRLPTSGDVNDPKNWAGLHTTSQVADAQTAMGHLGPQSDYYYPRVQKTLITYFGEFELNPWKRQTGTGPQKVTGKVYYENLKDLTLDSSFGEEAYWDDAWLTRFHTEVEQPSKQALAKKAMMRSLVSLIAPILGLTGVTTLDSVPDSFLTLTVLPALAAYLTYAKQTLYTEDLLNKMLGLPLCKTDEQGGEDYVKVRAFEDNYTEISRDHSGFNMIEFNTTIPENYSTCVCNECDTEPTKEIYYSNKQVEGSIIDSYRNFQANNNSVLPPHAGNLQKLFIESNRFYAHCTDGIYILQYNNQQQVLDNLTMIVGRGDLLTEPVLLMEGATEGFLGLVDKNSPINCKHGYIFPARDTGQIVQLYNGQPKILSEAGMKQFFEKQLDFCNPGGCIDERENTDIVLGYDPKNDRLLVTKRDGDDCSSWTVSYNFNSQSWTSFHSYIPRFYIWDRTNMFTIKDNDIYIHGVDTWDNLNFYGTQYHGAVDFVARHESGEPFMYMSTMIDSDAQLPKNNEILRGRHICFDYIALWTRTQGTGLLPIITRTDNPDMENDVQLRIQDKNLYVEANYAASQWRIHDLLDRVKNMNGELTSKDCRCTPHVRLLDHGDELPGLANLKERYMFYRLMISNRKSDHRIYLNSVITQMNMVVE